MPEEKRSNLARLELATEPENSEQRKLAEQKLDSGTPAIPTNKVET